jgi:hypothetical protein
MSDERHAGLRGRLPVKPPGERFAINYLSSYLKAPIPAPSYPIDISCGITDWQMLGNGPDPTLTVNHGQPVGDCTFAGRQHLRMAKAAAGHEHENWETSNQLVEEYLRYDHGKDEGANIADLLLSWFHQQKILAFAPVDHSDPAACDSAMTLFHGLYVGVNLTPDADRLFGEHRPWTVGGGQKPDPQDGHCIVKVKADGHGTDTWVTWGALQESTTTWTSACLDEAWAVVTTEDEAKNLDMTALLADIKALGGTS